MSQKDDEMKRTTETARPPEGVETVDARALVGPDGLLRIRHNGELYILRITRNDRLILTK